MLGLQINKYRVIKELQAKTGTLISRMGAKEMKPKLVGVAII